MLKKARQPIFLMVSLLYGVMVLGDENYAYLKYQGYSGCSHAAQERLMRMGFLQDWVQIATCKTSQDLWWVLEVKPKKYKGGYYAKLLNSPDPSNFDFQVDFFNGVADFIQADYIGPPKWMPSSLVYWDAYIGDWRYLKETRGRNIYLDLTEQDVLVLWIKYESIEDGLVWDASFDAGRLVELLGLGQSKLQSIYSGIFRFLGLQ
jgi:hypothetical protein